jgi:DNA polymerase
MPDAGETASAAAFIPDRPTLPRLRAAAAGCRGCELYREGTRTVFGSGPVSAALVLVGEIPGDEEDRAGKPFVGPSGRLLDRAMADAGLDRLQVYITNAVKHFHFVNQRGRRLHKTPSISHLKACRPWLEQEAALIAPKATVCLGVSAARAVLGRPVTISALRGIAQPHALFGKVFVTSHPSALLRMPDPALRAAAFERLVVDLRQAKGAAAAE